MSPPMRLVYVTCSVFASENERIIKRFLASQPAFELDIESPQDDVDQGLATPLKAAGFVQLDPVNNDTDGLFCAVLRRRPNDQPGDETAANPA